MIEIGRHKALKSSKRFHPALAVAQGFTNGVAMDTGEAGRLAERNAARRQIGDNPVDLIVEGEHGGDLSTVFRAHQADAHKSVLFRTPRPAYPRCMGYDAARARQAVRDAVEKSGLSRTEFALKAGFSRNHLTQFLAGKTNSLKLSTICKLAEFAGRHPYEFMGIDPPEPPALDLVALDAAEDLIGLATRVNAETLDAARTAAATALDLLRAARSGHSSPAERTPHIDAPPAPTAPPGRRQGRAPHQQ